MTTEPPDTEALGQRITALRRTHGSRSPAGLAHLERLLVRSRSERPAVAARLLSRVERRLTRLEQAASRPPDQPAEWTAERTDGAEAAGTGDRRGSGRAGLAELIAALAPRLSELPDSPRRRLDALLRRQEREVFAGRGLPLSTTAPASDRPVPLASARLFNELQSGQQMECFVVEARTRLPENPGPLNPETLVIRSLTVLRKTAPAYLERLLGQTEALGALAGLMEQGKRVEQGTAVERGRGGGRSDGARKKRRK